MRRALFLLVAVNPENLLQVKVLDSILNILNFRSMNPVWNQKLFEMANEKTGVNET